MDINPLGSRPTRKTSGDYFTGTVWQDPIIEAPEPASVRAAWVASSRARAPPGTPIRSGRRSTSLNGDGRVQIWGGPIKEIRAGDTVFFAPGEKHWHGAATHHRHDARRDAGGARRQAREWMEKVSDEQYGGKPA